MRFVQFRGGVCGAGPRGSKEATALVLEGLGKNLNQVSAVVREGSQGQSRQGSAVPTVQGQRMGAAWSYY